MRKPKTLLKSVATVQTIAKWQKEKTKETLLARNETKYAKVDKNNISSNTE